MASKLPELKFKQVGLNLNVVIGDEPLSIKIEDKVSRDSFKEKLESYRTGKKTPALLAEIMATIKPVSTEKKASKEKEITEVKAALKAEKNKAKTSKDSSKASKEVVKAVAETVKAVAAKKATKALPAAQKGLPAPAPELKAKTKAEPKAVGSIVDSLEQQLKDGKMSDADIKRMQELLNKSKKVETSKASIGTTRRGEY